MQARYEERGWSQAKTARALADWHAAHEQQLKTRGAPKAQLFALVRSLAARPGGVRVFVHFYSGPFDSEEIRTGGKVRVKADRLVGDGIIAADTLTEIAL